MHEIAAYIVIGSALWAISWLWDYVKALWEWFR